MTSDVRLVMDLDSPEFRQAAAIYGTSFPAGETRPLDRTKELLESGSYEMYVTGDGAVDGFALVYRWDGFALLDYMAVRVGQRGEGVGSSLFGGLLKAVDGVMLLEVQKPDSIDGEKSDRVRFYQRLGAVTITDGYVMPSYDGNPEVMLLMAAGGTNVCRDDVRLFVESIYRDVYGYRGMGLVKETMRSVPETVGLGVQ